MGQTVASFPDSQWSNRLPSKTYYQGLEHYRNGNLTVATNAFETALASSSKHEHGEWIDAIPMHALLGECYYQLGDLRRSIVHVEAAIGLFRRHAGWLDAIDGSDTPQVSLGPVDERAESVLQRRLSVMIFPTQFVLDVSNVNLPRAQVTDGLKSIAGKAKVDAIEILRGVATASYRRRVIVGAAAPGDGQAKPITLSPQPQTRVSGKLLEAVVTSVEFAGGKAQDAADWESIATIDGHIHPLTPLMYLAAARVAIERGADLDASSLAWNAAESAAALGQAEYFTEAVVLAVQCGDAESSNLRRDQVLNAAVSFLQRGRLAAIGALLAAGDASLIAGDAKVAETLVQQAVAMIQRGDMHQPRWAAHADYLLARVYASQGKSLGDPAPNEVDAAIARLLVFAAGNHQDQQTISSPKRFQLNRAIAQFDSANRRVANDPALLKHCTDDPPSWLWKVDPVDAISFLSMDRSAAHALQLRWAVARGDGNEIVTVADDLLRHRFLKELPLGGRVEQLRNLVSTHFSADQGEAVEQRKVASGRLKELMDAVSGFDSEAPPIGNDVTRLESLATELALSSQAIASTMPPPVQIEQSLGRMPAGLAMLIYVDLIPETLAILVSSRGIESWMIPHSRATKQEVVGLLRNVGVPAKHTASRLSDVNQWRPSAEKLCRRIIPPQHLQTIRDFDQLVVIPDGVLWYVPFELLLCDESKKTEVGLSISYSPTPGLGLSTATNRTQTYQADIAIVAGKLFAPDSPALEGELFEQVVAAWEDRTRLPAQNHAVEYRKKQTPRTLAILDCVYPSPRQPLSSSLIGIGKPDPLSDWLRLPRRVPQVVILPGFQSAGTQTPMGDGREMFLTVTALHCSGVEQVLISRWCVGGESTALLMSELLQELPYEEFRTSMIRATRVLHRQRLSPASEPLLMGNDFLQDDIDGDHPLFWSGYLLSVPVQTKN